MVSPGCFIGSQKYNIQTLKSYDLCQISYSKRKMKKHHGAISHFCIPALFLLIIAFYSFTLPAPSKVSIKMEAKMLNKGKVFIVNADIFYQFDQGRMLTHYIKPMDYLFITNNKGEAKVYFPESNEVMVRQSAEFDTEKSILYFFLSNKLRDLGLADMGFKTSSTRSEDGLVLTTDRISRCNRISAIDIHAAEFDSQDHKLHEDPMIYRLH